MSDATRHRNAPANDGDWAAEAEDALRPGTPLLQGQFLVEGFLNAGGFGITYLARDSLDRQVVLKECYPSSMCCRSADTVRARTRSQQPEFEAVVRLFGQEARRLSKLDHPNIVGVRDVFEENGTAYMALDHVAGRDLLEVIEDQPERLGPREIVEITRQLLDAIEHVHARGMLHRDISPDNVLLRRDNTPVLIDFGAARDTARRKSRLLSALHVVKDGYSPQEFYLQSGEQSPASDLYSLAASIYHAIVGAPPVYGHIRLAAIAERKPDPYVPLAGAVGGYGPGFLTAIDKTLSVFARDRLQSAHAWREAMAGPLPAPSRHRGHAAPLPFAQDPTIMDRIRKLVESTNAEVRLVQERRAKERAERAQREAEARRHKDAARKRRLEEARREAEEAEQERAERQAEEARARAEAEEVARRIAREAARRTAAGPSDAEATDGEPRPSNGLVVDPSLSPSEQARAVRLQRMAGAAAGGSALPPPPQAKPPAEVGMPRPRTGEGDAAAAGQGTLLGRVIGNGWKRSKGTGSMKGYGT